MKIVLEEVTSIANGIWLSFVAPHEIAKLATPQKVMGRRSVILTISPLHEKESDRLILETHNLEVLSVGTSPSVVVIDAMKSEAPPVRELDAPSAGRGDLEFLDQVARSLKGEAKLVAETLLKKVREKSPGDLKRGERLNFSNTPDNFWYVIVQPRVQALSITVRGLPERFEPSTLDLKIDRPGYTRFSLSKPSEVNEALRIIWLSRRKDEK
jgi:hypothetical protein